MTRHFWVLIHRYAGLAMTLFLIIVALTGSVLAFKDELDAWLNPDLLRVTPRDAPMAYIRQGALFEIDISGAMPVYNILHKFDGTDSVYHGQNGPDTVCFDYKLDAYFGCTNNPAMITVAATLNIGLLMEASDSKLYGTTTPGTVFQLDTSKVTPTFTTLHSDFDSSNSPLHQGADGKLYGTTTKGNGLCTGTVFQIDITGATPIHELLYKFDGSIGIPSDLIQGNDGNL